MKQLAIIGIIGAMFVLLVGGAYAYAGPHGMFIEDTTTMDEMHEQMTQDLEPDLKAQMDARHEEMRAQQFEGCPMVR